MTLAVTVGDPNGIGPEVILKALAKVDWYGHCRVIGFGPYSVFNHYRQELGLDLKLRRIDCATTRCGSQGEFEILESPVSGDFQLTPGEVNRSSGIVAGAALDQAVRAFALKEIEAVVTGPISKEAFRLAGYDFPGQTEYFSEKCGEDAVMLLVGGGLRIATVTTHCALNEVGRQITRGTVLRKLKILQKDLRGRFGIDRPQIAVSALNPHAGEGGHFGLEEIQEIEPAIRAAERLGIDAVGPYPADSLFARIDRQNYDAYLAMYHDQGLIPFKMRSFGRGVNYSAGLSLIRTSPDHGTALDIAGKGIADSLSMEEAIRLAVNLADKN